MDTIYIRVGTAKSERFEFLYTLSLLLSIIIPCTERRSCINKLNKTFETIDMSMFETIKCKATWI